MSKRRKILIGSMNFGKKCIFLIKRDSSCCPRPTTSPGVRSRFYKLDTLGVLMGYIEIYSLDCG